MQWVVVLVLMGAYLHLRGTQTKEDDSRKVQAEAPLEKQYNAPNDEISHLLKTLTT
jgi:hypothetical protein